MYPNTFVVSIEKCEPPGGVNLPAKRPVSLVSVHQRAQRTTSPIYDFDVENFPVDFGILLVVDFSTLNTPQRSGTKHADPHNHVLVFSIWLFLQDQQKQTGRWLCQDKTIHDSHISLT